MTKKRGPSKFMGCRVVVRCGVREGRGRSCAGWRGVVECRGRKVRETGLFRSKEAALDLATKLAGGSKPRGRAGGREMVCRERKTIRLRHWKTGTPFTREQCVRYGWR